MDNKLTFNHETGYYEGTIRIQVESEIFRRVVLKTIEDDPYTDLTSSETWSKIIERIAKVSFWVDRPHTRVTEPLKVIEAPKKEIIPNEEKKYGDKIKRVRQRVIEVARCASPHKWDELLTPIADSSVPEKGRDLIHQVRYNERQVLKKLREEYEKGEFVLSEEAEKEEQGWRQSQNNKLSTQIGTLENLVNGSKIH